MNSAPPSLRSTLHGTLRTTSIRSVRSALMTNTTGTRDASLLVLNPIVLMEAKALTILSLTVFWVVFAAEENPVPVGGGGSHLRLFLPASTVTRRRLQTFG